jgi:hypothetical protein
MRWGFCLFVFEADPYIGRLSALLPEESLWIDTIQNRWLSQAI